MELAIDILNKEIERREISLAVESNVLIQNDMHNEIGGLKDVVEKLTTPAVFSSTEYDCEGYFYCTNCKNKQLTSQTNDEAICNKCPNELQFYAYDAFDKAKNQF